MAYFNNGTLPQPNTVCEVDAVPFSGDDGLAAVLKKLTNGAWKSQVTNTRGRLAGGELQAEIIAIIFSDRISILFILSYTIHIPLYAIHTTIIIWVWESALNWYSTGGYFLGRCLPLYCNYWRSKKLLNRIPDCKIFSGSDSARLVGNIIFQRG